ncbi:MAG: RNA polymerase sigma factor [Nocardioidaceae bacterium]
MNSRDDVPPWLRSAEAFTRWLDGDVRGLDDLVCTLTPILCAIARSYGLPRHQVDDIVQNTWLSLLRGRDTIEDPDGVMGWLTSRARRAAWLQARVNQRGPSRQYAVTAGRAGFQTGARISGQYGVLGGRHAPSA